MPSGAALLVLFAGTARTRLVAAHFWRCTDYSPGRDISLQIKPIAAIPSEFGPLVVDIPEAVHLV